MGPSRSPSPLAGDAAQWGQGQGEMGSEPRTCGVTAEKGRNLLVPGLSGPGAGVVSTHRAMPVCSAGELGMNSCKNNSNKKKTQPNSRACISHFSLPFQQPFLEKFMSTLQEAVAFSHSQVLSSLFSVAELAFA